MGLGEWAGFAANPLGFIGTAAQLGQSAANLWGQREQRNWEEKMANTAYQRSVADMTKAGLNPALMFGSGQKADTPNVAPPTFENPLDAMFSAVSAAKTFADIREVDSRIEVQNAQRRNTDQDTVNKATANPYISREAEARIKAAAAGASRDTSTSAKTEAETSWEKVKGHLADHVLKWLESGDKEAAEAAKKTAKPSQDRPPEKGKQGPTSAKKVGDYPGIDTGVSVPINRGSVQ